ncbi:MAG: DNA mismatch repair protein MutS, partial [Gemmatimonadota bacterium]|nr:DNA mismatch repair protein MutS [Gemmatimonadota bacterium]
MAADDTPLIQQWREVKALHADALVLFRVGDFYEMFHEDAEEGSRLLNLTLTSRNNGSSRAPLAGIPVHALDTYLERLVRLGRRVAICEQTENPAEAKGLVRREVTETVTPGAIFADALLDARRNNFLVAIAGDPASDALLGLAVADLSTGELILRPIPRCGLADALGRVEPSELLLPRSWDGYAVPADPQATRTYRGDWLFDSENAAEELKRRFRVLGLEGFGLEAGDRALIASCGALVSYLAEVQPAGWGSLRPPRVDRGGHEMVLDEMTRRNLELVEPLRGTGRSGTLLDVLDEALTPMGGRLLRCWLLAPLLDPDAINARLDAIEELAAQQDVRAVLRRILAGVRDLERLSAKVGAGRASPRDLLALGSSLDCIPALRQACSPLGARLTADLRNGLDPLDDLRQELSGALDPEAPTSSADGGYIRDGYSGELDQLRATRDGATDAIAAMQQRERERTGISSLKVGFNRVFGYYFEVSRANLDRVPPDYHRKQTLANGERFFTPELKSWEETVLRAGERIIALEASLFAAVRERVCEHLSAIHAVSARIATLDVFAALAEVARRRDYVRPEVGDGFALEIVAGRHPVVETMMPREQFIPNDLRLDQSGCVVILTGPNMAGKSTVLRQVGLITLLAQIGSFVPARSASVGVVDRIFTRVGASDNLVRGQSTFMVEMNETAAILNGASERSLVLLDEIGRGTSTWDGLSVATATTEHLHDQIGAKTIFATHYQELTRLADRLPGVVNFSVAVREEHDEIIFLRRLVPGGADRSYGVDVARLAGLPPAVVERAREILRELETGGGT